MSKFKVMIVKKDGKPVGVRAAQVNGEVVILALNNLPEQMTYKQASKHKLPTLAQWLAIYENINSVNRALKKAGGEPLKKDDWYWSSTRDYYGGHYNVGMSVGSVDIYDRGYNSYYVRPVLAF